MSASCFLLQSGPDLSAQDTWGVNYRALQDLFKISKSRDDIIEYDIGVQMIEIYNEQVRDLLVVDGSSRRYPLVYYVVVAFACLVVFAHGTTYSRNIRVIP